LLVTAKRNFPVSPSPRHRHSTGLTSTRSTLNISLQWRWPTYLPVVTTLIQSALNLSPLKEKEGADVID